MPTNLIYQVAKRIARFRRCRAGQGMEHKQPVIVAGAGIVGASIAQALAARGEEVILVDRQGPGRRASSGNMASIAVNGFDAISRPSTWKKIPGWLPDPNAPVTADPLYAMKMV